MVNAGRSGWDTYGVPDLVASAAALASAKGQSRLVELVGEADATSLQLKDVLDAEVAAGPRLLVLELSRLTFMDSWALHQILEAARKLRAVSADLRQVDRGCRRSWRVAYAGSSAQTTFPPGSGSTAHRAAICATMCRPCPGWVTSGWPLSGAWSWTEIRALRGSHDTVTVNGDRA